VVPAKTIRGRVRPLISPPLSVRGRVYSLSVSAAPLPTLPHGNAGREGGDMLEGTRMAGND